MRNLPARCCLLLPLLIAPSACQNALAPAPKEVVRVVVSIAPQKQFVERIAGGRASVVVMVPPGADVHTYEPKPAQVRALSRAQLYLRIGIEFEDVWMDRLTADLGALRVVDTAAGITRQPLPGDAGDGPATGLDPHIWLSPRLVAIQARNIATALSETDPAHAAEYAANLAQFEAAIAALDTSIRRHLSGLEGRVVMAFHPSWGYFCRDYGLQMLAVEVEGQEPSAQEMTKLIDAARAAGVRVVFAQPSISTRTAQIIARELGTQVVLIDPLAEDWEGNLLSVAETMERALR